MSVIFIVVGVTVILSFFIYFHDVVCFDEVAV